MNAPERIDSIALSALKIAVIAKMQQLQRAAMFMPRALVTAALGWMDPVRTELMVIVEKPA